MSKRKRASEIVMPSKEEFLAMKGDFDKIILLLANVVELDLSEMGDSFGDEGTKAIAQSLNQNNTLQHLDLSCKWCWK